MLIGLEANLMLLLAPSPAGAAACGSESAHADLDRPKSCRLWRPAREVGMGARTMHAIFQHLPPPQPPIGEGERQAPAEQLPENS